MILSSSGQFMKSVSFLFLCWCVFCLATLYAKDLEQTLAETPRYTPYSLWAVICGMDWYGLHCLGPGSCVIPGTTHQAVGAAEATVCPWK